jgi:hypothetical protein
VQPNQRIFRSVAVVAALLVMPILIGSFQVHAAGYDIRKIGDGAWPDINESGTIVWCSGTYGPHDLILYNGTSDIIANNISGYVGGGPFINNNDQVVFSKEIGFDRQIYLYNNGITNKISETNWCHYPYINDLGKVTWVDMYNDPIGVYIYDGETPLHVDNILCFGTPCPKINNLDQIVYYDNINGGIGDIYVYKNSNPIQITNNHLSWWPIINNIGDIAWVEYDDLHYQNPKICVKKGNIVTKIAVPSIDPGSFAINDFCQIVFSDGYNNNIYLIDNDNIIRISNNGFKNYNPRINNNGKIVWYSYDNIKCEIYLATPLHTLPSVNTHWYNWATTFSNYGQLIKKYGVIRDGAWWEDLETRDYTSDADWANAAWSYSHDLTLANCSQSVSYQSGYDNLVKKFQDPDSPDLLMILKTNNKNINSDPNNITYTQYYDYVQYVVSRYNKNSSTAMPGLSKPVKYYEIGNEPDNPTLNEGLTLSNYVSNRLIPAYRAARQANPEAIVLNAGLYLGGDGGFDTSYLDNMLNLLKQNGGESNNYYMDILAIHYYYHPQDPENFLANIEKVRQIMSKYNMSSKPIWITEYGMATKNDAGGQIREEDQAAVLLRFNCLMKLTNIDNSIIYNLKDVNSNVPTWENTYGLYKVTCQQNTEQITAKQSVQVIDNFYKMTNGLNNISVNSIDERNLGVYRLTFSNGTKYVNVIWYTKMDGTGVNPDHASEAATIKVTMEGRNGVLSDMYGNILIDKIYNGTSIPIGEQPVYIESQKQISMNSFLSAILHLLLSN